ncbi:hypothetical protein PsB1_2280 [Candidatus Phycosocius spiralis]|uniref:Uncharacterized protein n=1 Tax=Candidatus Phycosocius spiralis TaxID=2815099 RepID=A0ABQ4PYH8_9PROT|nr:hypothetical protein PsB1_2280 [Candidatus Phycosocius spiralis]
MIEGKDLLHMVPTRDFPIALPPGSLGELVGVRMTTDIELLSETMSQKSVRLNLGRNLAHQVTTRPMRVIIQVRATPMLPSSSMAIGWVVNGQVTWVKQPVTSSFTAVQFNLPQPKTPPTALAIWPSVEGDNGGIEVKSILVAN